MPPYSSSTSTSSSPRSPLLEPYHHSNRRAWLWWIRPPSCKPPPCLARVLSSFFLFILSTARNNPKKTIHSLKFALAFTLAFLLVLLDAPYALFGSHTIWAIMTIVIIFEFSIGATLNKGVNRGVGTLAACFLAVIVGELAQMCGNVAHPVMVGVSVFIVGGVVTFIKMESTMKSYEYGFRIFLITFSLILVTEYRQDEPIKTAVNRVLIILIGGAIGLSVNLLIFPLSAGEELHEFIAQNFDSVADSLEVCVNEYLRGTILERVPSKIFMGLAADDPVYKGYRSALTSGAKEESLAGFAIWEPPHGKFWRLKYPWNNYVRVGGVLRHCAYSVVALHGCLRSAIQAPLGVRLLFENELREVGIEGAKVLRKLGKQVKNMEKGNPITVLDGVRGAVDRLQQSLYLNSYLLIRQEVGLEDDVAEDFPITVLPELKKYGNGSGNGDASTFFRTGSSHKMGIAYAKEDFNSVEKRCFKKLHSWPSRPIDDFDFAKDAQFEQRVRVLESASALSLGTFATLLTEVTLRLDYVVEAVDELGQLANFRDAEKEEQL